MHADDVLAELRALQATADDLVRQAEEFDAKVDAARVTLGSSGDLVRLSCDGRGRLVGLDIDPGLLPRTAASRLAEALLAALRHVRGPARELVRQQFAGGVPAPPESPATVGTDPFIASVVESVGRMRERLSHETVSATSTDGSVTIRYNGLGDPVDVSVTREAMQRDARILSRNVTRAIQAAQQAAARLRHREIGRMA